MTSLFTLEQLLTYVSEYGPVAVGLILFINGAGIPMPTVFLVIASGAFVHQDLMAWYEVLPISLIGVVAGDNFNFGLGRFAQGWVYRHWGENPAWVNAQQAFGERAGAAIFFSRWLFTPLATPINLVAGSSGYPFARFFVYDLAGESLWLVGYGFLGYLFGSQWQVIAEFISDFSGLVTGLALFALGIYWMRRRQRRRAARQRLDTLAAEEQATLP